MKEISTVIKSLLSRKQLEILQTVVDALNNGILRSERNMVTVHDDWYAPTGIETIVSTWYDGHLQDTDLVRIVRERINSDGSITEFGNESNRCIKRVGRYLYVRHRLRHKRLCDRSIGTKRCWH